MKKQYVNPTMEVVNLKMQGSLLAGSQNAVVSTEEQSNADALGRGYDDWDE